MLNDSEDLLMKHRKERKDLQNQIQNLKKSCAKGDKKKKKEIQDEIVRLELELDKKHESELSEIKQDVQTDSNIDESRCLSDDRINESEKQSRVSKAQKRRNKKASEEREREERIIKQEIKNKDGPRNREMQEMKRILNESGLELHSIPADGNCLYCAVDHQLRMTGREGRNVQELRKLTATYMREHRDDFLPFMTHHDEDKTFTDDMYEEYCNELAKKPVWGGQIEIRALSSALECPIQVVQAGSGATVQGEQYSGPPLVLAYHRHLYRLGEHYNSTLRLSSSSACSNDQ